MLFMTHYPSVALDWTRRFRRAFLVFTPAAVDYQILTCFKIYCRDVVRCVSTTQLQKNTGLSLPYIRQGKSFCCMNKS